MSGAGHFLPRYGPGHARYESTDSSLYDSSWFSDSPSVLSPTSPEAGYYSAGDASDFSANPAVWSPRSSIGYPISGAVFRPQASLTLDPSRLSNLHLSSPAKEVAEVTAKPVMEAAEEDNDQEGEHMSGDESEYLENKKLAPRKKGKRPVKLDEADTPGIESVSQVRTPMYATELVTQDFADARMTSAGRSARVRAGRLYSERKRRDALSIAFADLRSLLPPEVQKLTKSRIVGCFNGISMRMLRISPPQLEEAVRALQSARDEAAHYKQLCEVMQQRQAAVEAGPPTSFLQDIRQGGIAAGPSKLAGI